MMFLLAAAAAYHLVIMPIGDANKTIANRDLYKPFDVSEETFDTEEACLAFAKATIKAHLGMHGLPPNTVANFTCTNH